MEKSLIDAVNTARVVSFDIFDTAILRQLHMPQDVFSLVAQEGTNRFENFPEQFLLKRKTAERKAREKYFKQFGGRELNLKDIYDQLIASENISPEFAKSIMNLEIEIERTTCICNTPIFEVYNYAIKQEKTVVFATDMYLPSEVIENILQKNGYRDYRSVYVSNELGKSKREGEMFSYITSDLGVAPRDILHIGDDELSDIIMAKKNGFSSWYYKRCRDRYIADKKYSSILHTKNTTAKSIYMSLIARKFYSDLEQDVTKPAYSDFWYRFGYEMVGILYLGFTKWLLGKFRENNIDHAYFLSRDGYIMEKVYKALVADKPGYPSSSYLKVSRVSLAMATLQNLDEKELQLFISDSELRNVAHYIERFGLNAADYVTEIIDAGFPSMRSLVADQKDRKKLLKLLQNLKVQILEKSREQNKLVKEYFNQNDLFEERKIALVDIGWKASMQSYILEILDKKSIRDRISGYYLGTSREILKKHDLDDSAFGYLCEGGYPEKIFKSILSCVPLVEFLFTAPHGCIAGYHRNDSGEVEAEFDDAIIEKQIQITQVMQNGALDFINDFTSFSDNYSSIEIKDNLAFAPVERVIKKPSYEESVKIGDLKHIDSFENTKNARHFARPPSIIGFLNPMSLRRKYLQSHWKTGFIIRISNHKHLLPVILLNKLKAIKSSISPPKPLK